jgi:DNA-binding XRE family transcriptional regulator
MTNENNPGKLEVKERFIELRAAGLSYEAVSKEMGVSKQTLINWSKDLVLNIRNARSLRLDELSQKYIVAKEKRIEVFGQRLDAILAELDKRTLAELETEKLLTLALKFGEMLRTEYEPLTLARARGVAELDLNETVTWEG